MVCILELNNSWYQVFITGDDDEVFVFSESL